MELFVWAMALSFHLLFIILSGIIFFYLRDRSFKYYGLYNIFLILYMLSRSGHVDDGFQEFIRTLFGNADAKIFIQILTFLLPVAFCTFYSFFAFYVLGLDKNAKKYFKRSKGVVKSMAYLFVALAAWCYELKNADLFATLFLSVYVPVMLAIFLLIFLKFLRFSTAHQFFFVAGLAVLVFCSFVALAGSFLPSLGRNPPLTFFFVGNLIEKIFFSLGLAHKLKLINEETNRINVKVARHRHRQHISKLQGLLEGEEKERKRLAEELHDGIAGDLSAIKYNLAFLRGNRNGPDNERIIGDLMEIIDKSCIQLREISHNLSPSCIITDGLVTGLQNFCMKMENTYHLPIKFSHTGEAFEVNKVIGIHIYRIVQELINNILKHAEAANAEVSLTYLYPELILSVKDDGKGFEMQKNNKGIGFANIDSRIRFMNAQFSKLECESGSAFRIVINIDHLPETC